MKEYYAHYRKENDKFQLNQVHQKNVAILSRDYCQMELLKSTAYISGLCHDGGKFTDNWQKYLQKNIQEETDSIREKADHSTLGGLMIREYLPESILSEMIQMAVFTHHGLVDCISMEDGIPLLEKRAGKYSREEILEIQKRYEQVMPEENMKNLCCKASEDIKCLLGKIVSMLSLEEWKGQYGNKNFYLGMCERLLFSVLADADVRDTVDFVENRKTELGLSNLEMNKIWEQAEKSLEKRLDSLQKKTSASPLAAVRAEISHQCAQAAGTNGSRYRLAVPTGAGKSLSALRFALHRAFAEKKRHVFYVAPFRSILEQNCEEIRKAVGNPDWVLEHHGDAVPEDETENYRYERLIENWDEVPIIATTAVQFFNTVFKEKKRNLRRFHSLCNSVLIFDEVQAFPEKVQGLFNLLMNFLTEFCNSTIVLCTATQLPLERRRENSLLKTENMTASLSVYEPQFRRVEYYDCTENGVKSFSMEDAVDFIGMRAAEEKQVLAIFNTKRTAREIYEKLKGKFDGRLFHLSTSMCAENREDVLIQIKKALDEKENVLCISTQLVEAGVDFSFRCVIRSLAGLDNLIQAAGRCNRHGGKPLGKVYLIGMSQEAEDLTYLPEIRTAQNAMRKILRVYHQAPDKLGGRLDSERAIQEYYVQRFMYREAEARYPVKAGGIATDLVDLLSSNKEITGRIKKVKLKQAFRTAGELFSMIEEKGGMDVVVPYGKSQELLYDLAETEDRGERKYLMRKLQKYIVNLSENTMKKMGPGAVSKLGEKIFVLDKRYYNDEIGVQTEPQEMEFLGF